MVKRTSYKIEWYSDGVGSIRRAITSDPVAAKELVDILKAAFRTVTMTETLTTSTEKAVYPDGRTAR